jgi:hypothetical protein
MDTSAAAGRIANNKQGNPGRLAIAALAGISGG